MPVVIGLYFANKNKTLEEYTLGGKSQRLIPVSISMMTSFMSGITLIGNSAEYYYHGIAYSTTILGTLLSTPISALLLLPVFHRLELVSVFEYFELRYSGWLKKIISITFVIQMTLYNAVVLFIPSMSLQSVLGISEIISVGAVGLSCLIYSTAGGIKAVIWTDFFQAFLMIFSLMCICVGGTLEIGGFEHLWQVNTSDERFSFESYFQFNMETRHTLMSMCLSGTLINVFMGGANQVQVQRARSLPTLRLSQWSLVGCNLLCCILSVIASYIGLILYANYKDCDPYSNGQIDKRDALLIYYVATNLKDFPGLRGIFVAGIFAATLSTLSSFQNSMATLLMQDFIRPSLGARSKLLEGERNAVYLSKFLALVFGIVCIGLVFVVAQFSALLQVCLTLFGAIGAPLIAAFILGMTTRFVNSAGMATGTLVGYTFGLYVQFYQLFYLPPLQPSMPLSVAECPAHLTNITSVSHITMLGDRMDTGDFGPADIDATSGFFDHIGKMSYLMLPIVGFLLTVVVAIVVSLLTGGLSQQVEDKFLISWMHRPQKEKQASTNYGFELDKEDSANVQVI